MQLKKNRRGAAMMRLIYFVESSYFFHSVGRIAETTPEGQKRFRQLVEWLCECIRQDPVPLIRGAKMLILWQAIGGTRLCVAQDLQAEISRQFPRMQIEIGQLANHLERAWIMNEPYAILKDNELIEKIREKGIRYLIGIF